MKYLPRGEATRRSNVESRRTAAGGDRRGRHRWSGGGARAGAKGRPNAGARTGPRVQGSRRRHSARAERLPHVRRAGPDRRGQPARGLSREPDHARRRHRRGGDAGSARRTVSSQVHPSLCAHLSARPPGSAAGGVPHQRAHRTAYVTEGRGGGRAWRRRDRAHRQRDELRRCGADRRRRIVVHDPAARRRRRQAAGRRPHHLSRGACRRKRCRSICAAGR